MTFYMKKISIKDKHLLIIRLTPNMYDRCVMVTGHILKTTLYFTCLDNRATWENFSSNIRNFWS